MSLRTLIVDDDTKFRKLVEIRLRSWRKDMEITLADNLTQARSILDAQTQKFTLIVLDQHLPDGMGPSLLDHPLVQQAAVLAVSADAAPELPAQAVLAGAHHFLGKRQISEPLFIPLVDAIVERKQLELELMETRLRESRIDTIKVLLGTLRHEINNPLGAVLGATFLLRSGGALADEQQEALKLIDESGQRIKHVIKELCEAAELEEVRKGAEQVFHVPGDPKWGKDP